jgi:hypothetical protein
MPLTPDDIRRLWKASQPPVRQVAVPQEVDDPRLARAIQDYDVGLENMSDEQRADRLEYKERVINTPLDPQGNAAPVTNWMLDLDDNPLISLENTPVVDSTGMSAAEQSRIPVDKRTGVSGVVAGLYPQYDDYGVYQAQGSVESPVTWAMRLLSAIPSAAIGLAQDAAEGAIKGAKDLALDVALPGDHDYESEFDLDATTRRVAQGLGFTDAAGDVGEKLGQVAQQLVDVDTKDEQEWLANHLPPIQGQLVKLLPDNLEQYGRGAGASWGLGADIVTDPFTPASDVVRAGAGVKRTLQAAKLAGEVGDAVGAADVVKALPSEGKVLLEAAQDKFVEQYAPVISRLHEQGQLTANDMSSVLYPNVSRLGAPTLEEQSQFNKFAKLGERAGVFELQRTPEGLVIKPQVQGDAQKLARDMAYRKVYEQSIASRSELGFEDLMRVSDDTYVPKREVQRARNELRAKGIALQEEQILEAAAGKLSRQDIYKMHFGIERQPIDLNDPKGTHLVRDGRIIGAAVDTDNELRVANDPGLEELLVNAEDIDAPKIPPARKGRQAMIELLGAELSKFADTPAKGRAVLKLEALDVRSGPLGEIDGAIASVADDLGYKSVRLKATDSPDELMFIQPAGGRRYAYNPQTEGDVNTAVIKGRTFTTDGTAADRAEMGRRSDWSSKNSPEVRSQRLIESLNTPAELRRTNTLLGAVEHLLADNNYFRAVRKYITQDSLNAEQRGLLELISQRTAGLVKEFKTDFKQLVAAGHSRDEAFEYAVLGIKPGQVHDRELVARRAEYVIKASTWYAVGGVDDLSVLGRDVGVLSIQDADRITGQFLDEYREVAENAFVSNDAPGILSALEAILEKASKTGVDVHDARDSMIRAGFANRQLDTLREWLGTRRELHAAVHPSVETQVDNAVAALRKLPGADSTLDVLEESQVLGAYVALKHEAAQREVSDIIMKADWSLSGILPSQLKSKLKTKLSLVDPELSTADVKKLMTLARQQQIEQAKAVINKMDIEPFTKRKVMNSLPDIEQDMPVDGRDIIVVLRDQEKRFHKQIKQELIEILTNQTKVILQNTGELVPLMEQLGDEGFARHLQELAEEQLGVFKVSNQVSASLAAVDHVVANGVVGELHNLQQLFHGAPGIVEASKLATLYERIGDQIGLPGRSVAAIGSLMGADDQFYAELASRTGMTGDGLVAKLYGHVAGKVPLPEKLEWLRNVLPAITSHAKRGMLTNFSVFPNPKFFINNMLTAPAIVASTLGVSRALNSVSGESVEVLRYLNGWGAGDGVVVTTPVGKAYKASELGDLANKLGVSRSQASAELTNDIIQDVRKMVDQQGALSKAKHVVYDLPNEFYQEVADQSDSFFRLNVFISALREGQHPEAAAELARRSLFDYGKLTTWERDALVGNIWFYTFARQNMMNLLEAIVTSPRRLNPSRLPPLLNYYMTGEPPDIGAEQFKNARVLLARFQQEDDDQFDIYSPSVPQTEALMALVNHVNNFVGMFEYMKWTVGGQENPNLATGEQVKEYVGSKANPWVKLGVGLLTEYDIGRAQGTSSSYLDPRLGWWMMQNPAVWNFLRTQFDIEQQDNGEFKLATAEGKKRWWVFVQVFALLGVERPMREQAVVLDRVSQAQELQEESSMDNDQIWESLASWTLTKTKYQTEDQRRKKRVDQLIKALRDNSGD